MPQARFHTANEQRIYDWIDWYLRAVWDPKYDGDPSPMSVVQQLRDRMSPVDHNMFSDRELAAMVQEVLDGSHTSRTVQNQRDYDYTLPSLPAKMIKEWIKTFAPSYLGADGVYDFTGLKNAGVVYLKANDRKGFDFWKFEQQIIAYIESQGATYRRNIETEHVPANTMRRREKEHREKKGFLD